MGIASSEHRASHAIITVKENDDDDISILLVCLVDVDPHLGGDSGF